MEIIPEIGKVTHDPDRKKNKHKQCQGNACLITFLQQFLTAILYLDQQDGKACGSTESKDIAHQQCFLIQVFHIDHVGCFPIVKDFLRTAIDLCFNDDVIPLVFKIVQKNISSGNDIFAGHACILFHFFAV